MEHLHNVADDDEFLVRNGEPVVEGMRQFGSDLFAGHLKNVGERLQQFLKSITNTINVKTWNTQRWLIRSFA